MLPLLYKYCKFNENNYDYKNLENDSLYFASPTYYNDPYEGVIANNLVDLFEAFFIAQALHLKDTSFLQQIPNAFLLPKIILNIKDLPNTKEIKNYVRTSIKNLIEKAKYNNIQLVSIEALYNELYIQNFRYISDVSMPIDVYSTIIKIALQENKRLSSKERECYYSFLVNNYKEKYYVVNEYRKKHNLLIPIALVDAIFNTPFRRNSYKETLEEYNNIAIETFENIRAMPGKMFLTTCLSETPTSILMWSHYSMNHTGFCIEYDFNLLSSDNSYILDHLEKVCYKDQLPKLQTASLVQIFRKKLDSTFQKNPTITSATAKTYIEAILTKNVAWSYEQEWRLIFINQNLELPQKIPCASKIILGTDISESNKALLLSLAQKKNLPVFQAYLLPHRYAIDFYQIQ